MLPAEEQDKKANKKVHLKNFIKKEIAPSNRLEERREPTRERVARPVNDGLSETINMVIKEEAAQALRVNRKKRRDGKQKKTSYASHITYPHSSSLLESRWKRCGNAT